MFGRLILILAVMWRLCVPQQAMAWTPDTFQQGTTQTRVTKAEDGKADLPAAWLDEQEEEELSETELDDTDHAELGFGPAVLPSVWDLVWEAHVFAHLELSAAVPTGVAKRSPLALYVLHGQMLL